jgi:peptidoglycan/LPS O-acetylase OafA/YrhL
MIDRDRNHAIDILRVAAVTLVLLYHSMGGQGGLLGWLGGAGWIGVDLFFVLSGFLVTQTYLDLLERNGDWREALGRFYVRRCRRILPAYLVAVAALTGLLLCFPHLRVRSVQELPYYLGFIANRADVVGAVFWSIAVEAQFYFALPAIGLGRPGRRLADVVVRHPGVALGAAFIGPALVRAGLYHFHPELAVSRPQLFGTGLPRVATFGDLVYKNSLGHADGLLLGTWLGVQHRAGRLRRLGPAWARGAVLVGGVLLVGMDVLLAPWRTWMPRPWGIGVFGFTLVGFAALLLVAGCAVAGVRGDPTLGRVRVVRWVSDRIYSLYLGQAVASAFLSRFIPWSTLPAGSGAVMTIVYLGMAGVGGACLYWHVERRWCVAPVASATLPAQKKVCSLVA